ncbi:MAG: hypothetical protein J7M25_07260 [Deltaproteobacteria bacterium]|nr:hypothetical protein [Deltaproteobacteria bacterium]
MKPTDRECGKQRFHRKRLEKRAQGMGRRRGRSGQAVVEYALVSLLLTGGGIFMFYTFFPSFINAFQRYYDSFYVMLNLPFP